MDQSDVPVAFQPLACSLLFHHPASGHSWNWGRKITSLSYFSLSKAGSLLVLLKHGSHCPAVFYPYHASLCPLLYTSSECLRLRHGGEPAHCWREQEKEAENRRTTVAGQLHVNCMFSQLTSVSFWEHAVCLALEKRISKFSVLETCLAVFKKRRGMERKKLEMC